MMDWTTRHCRYFHRLLGPRAVLYTEMLHSGAILHGDRARLLGFDPSEHPLAVQIGGSDPKALAESARIAEQAGFDEVNLNLGCPSERVQNAAFGACLMLDPARVADCLEGMIAAVGIPVSVKIRIGVDTRDSWEYLRDFVAGIATTGCRVVIVHARKAWLRGLSPKQNREVPQLDHERVYQLKQEFPEVCVVINGGIRCAGDVQLHLAKTDGAMLGRAAYHDPWVLTRCHERLWPGEAPTDRGEIVRAMRVYAEREMSRQEISMGAVCRPLLGLFHGQRGARNWRRHISERAHRSDATPQLLLDALSRVER